MVNANNYKPLKLVYYYTTEPSDTIRFPTLMKQYCEISQYFSLETIKKGKDKKIEVYTSNGVLLGTMYGIPSKSILIDIYNDYQNKITTRY